MSLFIKLFISVFSCLFYSTIYAQMGISATVISSAGSSGTNISGDIQNFNVSHTFGETAIFSASNMQNYAGQGFHSASLSRTVSIHTLPTFDKYVKLFPNPVVHNIQIVTDHTIMEIRIYDISGKLVKRYVSPDQEILDVSTLSSGQYFLQAGIQTGYFLSASFVKI